MANYQINKITLPTGDVCRFLGTIQVIEYNENSSTVGDNLSTRTLQGTSSFFNTIDDLLPGTRIAYYIGSFDLTTQMSSSHSNIPASTQGTNFILTLANGLFTSSIPVFKGGGEPFTEEISFGSIVLLTYVTNFYNKKEDFYYSEAWIVDTDNNDSKEQITTATGLLSTSGWNNKTQTISVAGVTTTNTVLVTYSPTSKSEYINAGVYCTAQGDGTLTFTCINTPTLNIYVNIIIYIDALSNANGEVF